LFFITQNIIKKESKPNKTAMTFKKVLNMKSYM